MFYNYGFDEFSGYYFSRVFLPNQVLAGAGDGGFFGIGQALDFVNDGAEFIRRAVVDLVTELVVAPDVADMIRKPQWSAQDP